MERKGQEKRAAQNNFALGSSLCVVSLDSSHVFGGRDKTVSYSLSDETEG